MRKENVYRELTRRLHPVPAKELKLDWKNIEESEDLWEDELVDETSPWEEAFTQGATEASFREDNSEDEL